MSLPPMPPIHNLALLVNPHKQGAEAVAHQLSSIASQYNTSTSISFDKSPPHNFFQNQDACCVVGGDGTILNAAYSCLTSNIPIFGINVGKLGFLATLSTHDLHLSIPPILLGNYQIKLRSLLQCSLSNSSSFLALNDIVIKHALPSKIMYIEVFCNDEYITSYGCDGLILSTPTGSTAYNLSAGGPLIYPESPVFAMTPICPHTLTNRTLIFDHSQSIKINYTLPDNNALIFVDGSQVPSNFPISSNLSSSSIKLLQPLNYSHFQTLRTKLNWGNSSSIKQ